MEAKSLQITSTDWEVRNFNAMIEMASQLIVTGFLPQAIRSPQQAVAIIMTGRELGIPTMQALRQINVIQGKPTISPELLLSLAYQRVKGFSHSVLKTTNEECQIEFNRDGSKPYIQRFTIQDAQGMQLAGKDNWKKQPNVMLRWRCVSAGLRIFAPDAISGFYTPEEMAPDSKVDFDTGTLMEEKRAPLIQINQLPVETKNPSTRGRKNPFEDDVPETMISKPQPTVSKTEMVNVKTGEVVQEIVKGDEWEPVEPSKHGVDMKTIDSLHKKIKSEILNDEEIIANTITTKFEDIVSDAVEIFQPTSVVTIQKEEPKPVEKKTVIKIKKQPEPIKIEVNNGIIQVLNSYPIKDKLRTAGYRWDVESKSWAKPYVSDADINEVQRMIQS